MKRLDPRDKKTLDDLQRMHKAEKIFEEALGRFIAWLSNSPTGSFSLTVPVHQGGIRKHKFSVEEDG